MLLVWCISCKNLTEKVFCKKIYFFCQVLARNVFSARTLQDLYFLSRSGKNLSRIVFIFNQGIHHQWVHCLFRLNFIYTLPGVLPPGECYILELIATSRGSSPVTTTLTFTKGTPLGDIVTDISPEDRASRSDIFRLSIGPGEVFTVSKLFLNLFVFIPVSDI